MTYSSLSKRFPKHSYFCGWYYRCQSNKQTLAIIPSVHKTKDSAFCTIQVITDTHAFHVQFPYDDLGEDDDQIRISNNRYSISEQIRCSPLVADAPPKRACCKMMQQALKRLKCLHPADVGAVIDRPRATNGRPYGFDRYIF